MTTLSKTFGLISGDRLVHPIKGFPTAKHHGIFLGTDQFGNQWISENHKSKGVQVVPAESYIAEYGQIERIERFVGSDAERYFVVSRALSQAGKPYDLVINNCEHHASYAQNGISESKQVRNVFLGALGLIIAVALLD